MVVGPKIVAIQRSGRYTTDASIQFIWALLAIITSLFLRASYGGSLCFMRVIPTLYASQKVKREEKIVTRAEIAYASINQLLIIKYLSSIIKRPPFGSLFILNIYFYFKYSPANLFVIPTKSAIFSSSPPSRRIACIYA